MNYLVFQLKTALSNFSRNKVRTVLTSLGILIGVLSVVILIALGLGLRNFIQGEFDSLGSNLLFILPGDVIGEDGQFSGGGGGGVISTSFDERDVSSLRSRINAEFIVPLYTSNARAQAGDITKSADVFASTQEAFTLFNFEPESGELFDESDVAKRSKVVVLGNAIAKDLFGEPANAVGQTIRFSEQRFKVLGVLKEEGGGNFGGPNFDRGLFIPYTTSFVTINTDRKFFAIYVRGTFEQDVEDLKLQIERALLRRYDDDQFSVVKQTEVLNAIQSIFSIINTVLLAIGSISLIVGGIGIMNIMYANVTERTKEIGIRRAVGATKKDILFQFLTESVLLSVVGGVLAVVLAALIVAIVQQFFPLALDATAVVVALGISSAIGIFFGVFPARRAANLTPIEAIRYE
jgi:putative ABC transport system permease protein